MSKNKKKAATLAAKKANATKVATAEPTNKVETTKVETKVEKPVEEPAPTPAPAPAPETQKAEKPKAEKAKDKKQEKAAEKDKPKVDIKPKAEKVETVVAEEVKVENPKNKSVDIGKGLLEAGGNDRISHDSGITLTKMFADEFVKDDTLSEPVRKAAKTYYRGLLMSEILLYGAQVEADMQTFGVRVNRDVFNALQEEAKSMWGIELKALPDKENDQQMVIDFTGSNIPKEVKEAAKADANARTEVAEIPEPNKDMEESEKEKVLRAILVQSTTNKSVFGKINQAIEWCRVAYGMEDSLPAQILAFIMLKVGSSWNSALDAVTSAMYGSLNSEHTVLAPHALLKAWNPTADDKNISQLVRVFISRHVEKQCASWNEKAKGRLDIAATETGVANNLVIVTHNIKLGLQQNVLDGVLKKEKKIQIVDEDKKPFETVNGDNVYKKLSAAYGDSESILKDKIAEISKLYNAPVNRLTNYVDKSAYAK
ncbi:MAG: hypothetical protein [Bacteriophage sp.]|nr:MAG: hypothetical protein [Bacteriophage sp.]